MAGLDFQILLSLLLNGLATSSMLFIVASGLSIIFGVLSRELLTRLVLHARRLRCLQLQRPFLPASGLNFWFGVVAADDSRCNGRTSDRTCSS